MNTNTNINSSSVILVSGGGRGVTAQCTIKLAEQYQCKFILLGRSELTESEPTWAKGCFDEAELKKRIIQDFITQGDKPTPVKVQKVFNSLLAQREIAITISEIQQAGGQVKYLSADIINQSTLQAKLASVVQSTGQITGIIHGAGVLADKLIENKTERDFDTVYAAKIDGLENLLSCVEPNQLDFIVLFSSFVAFYGNAGQSDYALANEILNKTAYLLQRKYPSCHVVSVGWGPWDGGMVTPELKKVFSQLNMELIPLEVGAQMLVDELKPSYHGTAQTLVMSSAIAASPKPLYSKSRTFRFRRKLTLEANPFVCDHAFGGKAVLPAMCSIAWIANTCEQIYPGYKFFSCNNYKVLKGIIFDQSLSTEYVLDVKEINRADSGEIDFEVLVWSESAKGIPYYHYSTQVKLLQEVPQERYFKSLNLTQDPALLSLFPYQNGTLFHKRNFQGIKQILHMTSDRLIAQCQLDKIDIRTQGQFPIQTFNPYTSDLLFQCLLVWVRHFSNLGSLPLQVKKLEQFKEIPFEQEFYVSLEILSNQQTNFFASGTVYDSQGEIYMQISDMQVTASERLNPLFLNNSLVG
ncbi:SDR family NAD(P)-dependent oxidoreductase [Scytonema sp. UIC 10036]|uniref:SDR family NAD(P)-dependent oxidoreductase n=1 Tax=Scytonema sp. UIC 10036 TaxID=2304196 RepID=UPI0012DAB802|nr:SDR family NAD(P)-dependent oxidoreductase [Scytonema sp. UIC 10036]MUG99160.1 SDR family NAD(P)-dependent oxidoreductase [Scytonema sp. UIC 10036]